MPDCDVPGGMLGRSPAFRNAMHLLRRFARARAPVLILGETGTGKELAARTLHYLGPHRGGPFVPLNCAALPDTLLESELFGHVRGAFTDAHRDRPGLIEVAEGGTLFLDEVDSLTPRAQAALLRFLQEGCFRPVGGGAERRADVSIVAASNAALEDLVSAGRFRSDLYYRLDVARVVLPPLRERPDDILLLADHFLHHFRSLYGDGPVCFSEAVRAWMLRHDWPGNIRELENFVHREFLKAEGTVIRFETEPDGGAGREPVWEDWRTARRRVVESFERQYLHRLMAYCHGNVSQAARLVGKERRALGRLLKKYGIDRRHYLSGAGPAGS